MKKVIEKVGFLFCFGALFVFSELAGAVEGPPAFTTSSTNQTVCAGTNLTLTAVAQGFPSFYQWRLNETDIPDATNSTLSLPAIRMDQGGVYSVTAQNTFGRASCSNTVTVVPLIVSARPLSDPAKQSYYLYGGVYLTSTTTGATPITYQWQFKGTNIAKTAYYFIKTNLQYADAGPFTLVASNIYGAVTSAPVNLPMTQISATGDTSTGHNNVPLDATNIVDITGSDLTCLALRADRSVLTWGTIPKGMTNLTNVVQVAGGCDHNVALYPDGTVNVWSFNNLGGVTNIPPNATNIVALAKGAGAWHVLALRKDGTVVTWGRSFDSSNIPPSVTNVVSVASGSFTCYALRGDGVVICWGNNGGGPVTELPVQAGKSDAVGIASQWYSPATLRSDGTVDGISMGNNFIDVACSGSTTLALSKSGLVTEYGANGATRSYPVFSAVGGSSYNSFAIAGDGPPFITSPSIDRYVPAGKTAYVRVTASGALPLSYQWRFNGGVLPGATNQLLALTNIQFTQAGSYSVVVSNRFGVVTNDEIALKVIPMMFGVQVTNSTAFAGGTAALQTRIVAATPIFYQWQYKGVNIESATNALLTLTNLSMSQSGEYSVVVSNAYGTVISSNYVVSVLPLVITNPPKSKCVIPGMSATFIVDFASTLPVTCQWKRNGEILPGETNRVLVVSNAVFVPGGYFTSSGKYSVVISNDLGSVESTAADLFVSRLGAFGNTPDTTAAITAGLTDIIGIHPGVVDLALQADGTVLSLGAVGAVDRSYKGVISVGENRVLREDGTLGDFLSYSTSPLGMSNLVSVCYTLALDSDGKVLAWGSNNYGQTNVPVWLSNVVAISEGFVHNVALRSDGTVVAWGSNSEGATNVPPGLSNVVAISAGYDYTIALKSDGTLAGWGDDARGNFKSITNAQGIVSIAVGNGYALGLRADGTVCGWGTNRYGVLDALPFLQNVNSITTESYDVVALALIGDGPPLLHGEMTEPSLDENGFKVRVPTQSGRVYGLEYCESLNAQWTALPLIAGNGKDRTLCDSNPGTRQRFYRVRRW